MEGKEDTGRQDLRDNFPRERNTEIDIVVCIHSVSIHDDLSSLLFLAFLISISRSVHLR